MWNLPSDLSVKIDHFHLQRNKAGSAMSKPNGLFPIIVFLLVLTSTFSHKLMVFGSPVQEQRFKRPDPLRDLHYYNEGYNVTNGHYWASAAFTGVHGYAIAGVWLICGLGFGIFVACKNQSSDSSSVKDHMDQYYFLMFWLIILFTIVAIVASSIVFAANESSLRRTKMLKGTIIKAGQHTRRTIHKVVEVMAGMQQLLLPYDPGTSLRFNRISHVLKKDASIIQNFVKKSGHAIDLEIVTSHTLHAVVVTINLVFLVASLVVLLFHWHPGFITIIFVFWILTSLFWALAGFDFFFYNFAKDTCTAFQDFEQNPQNSSLSPLIPCMDPVYADKVLAEIGNNIHNFISQLNSKIRELHWLLELDGKNLNLKGVEEICDPFSGAPNYTYTPEKCPQDANQIRDLPNLLSNLTCYQETSSDKCRRQGKIIPEAFHDVAGAYMHSIQDMLDIFPDLESLTKCIILKMTFSDVLRHQCKPFKFSIRLLWSSMLALSIFMVILVLIWVAKAYQERSRHFSRFSIVPDPI